MATARRESYAREPKLMQTLTTVHDELAEVKIGCLRRQRATRSGTVAQRRSLLSQEPSIMVLNRSSFLVARDRFLCPGVDLPIEAGTCGRLLRRR